MTEPTVHVVDDDTSFLLAIARLLRASGFRVETYASATAFLDQRRGDEPGCVIADLRMPEVDGLDLQSALARTENPLPLLFLTGQADTASTVRAMRGGAEDFLEKTAEKEPSPRRSAPGAGPRPAGARGAACSSKPCVCASMPSARANARCSVTSCAAG